MHRRRLLRLGALALLAGTTACRPRSGPPGDVAGEDHEPDPTPDPTRQPTPDPTRDPTPDPTRDPTPDPGDPTPEPTPEQEDAPGAPIEVICREALGLAAAGAGARHHRIRQLTLHHTGVELEANHLAPPRIRSHQGFHQGHGWADIAYHYGIDLAGNVYELRDPGTAGDTFTDYDPAGHFLVVCEGNYDVQVPSDAMLQAIAELMAYGAVHHDVPLDTLSGHRDHATTSCPGDGLYAKLDDLGAEAARLLALAPPELDVVCGPAAAERVARIEEG